LSVKALKSLLKGIEQRGFYKQIKRFFNNPHKPMILALARPDPKKNIPKLLTAFGECRALRELANLVDLFQFKPHFCTHRFICQGTSKALSELQPLCSRSSLSLKSILKLTDL
jgi:hypothetical protein